MYQWQRVHFIDELKHHDCVFDCFNPLTYTTAEEANEKLLGKVVSKTYDLFFTNVCYEKVLFPETVTRIKQMGIPTLCLRCDNLVIPYNDRILAPYFDLVWLTSVETQFLYDKWGANTIFAPYAANPNLFTYVLSNEITRKVCFIGTPYGSRSRMINALSLGEIPIDVYYKKIDQVDKDDAKRNEGLADIQTPSKISVMYHRLLFPQGRKLLYGVIKNRINGQLTIRETNFMHAFPAVSPQEQAMLYSKYRLALASTSTNHTDVLDNPLKIINLRNFEIPMSGGIEICRYNSELAKYFEDKKEMVFYNDNDDLVKKAYYYVNKATDSEIQNIKSAARKKALGEHTWWHRFIKVFDRLGISY